MYYVMRQVGCKEKHPDYQSVYLPYGMIMCEVLVVIFFLLQAS